MISVVMDGKSDQRLPGGDFDFLDLCGVPSKREENIACG
jgi:hypothetical protein